MFLIKKNQNTTWLKEGNEKEIISVISTFRAKTLTGFDNIYRVTFISNVAVPVTPNYNRSFNCYVFTNKSYVVEVIPI